ncbi:MAG TPA: sugar transferase [Actinomycetota bacterium]|nr:sugar transferase [Actinomycetota bacterium]
MTRRVRLAVKRGFDVAVSCVLLLLLSPVMAVVALVVRLDSPGPALFRQERTGRGGVTFSILKFRSMVRGAERSGPVMSMSDARVTTTGRVLRRTSLDELPQLLNVLRGEMSLVGPRPLLPGTTRATEARRLEMRPGVTSLVEVSNPHLLSWDERMQVDVSYVEEWSLWLDLRILVRTIPVVFTRKDILDTPRDKAKEVDPR